MTETGPIKKRALSSAAATPVGKKAAAVSSAATLPVMKKNEQTITHIAALDIEKKGQNTADSYIPELAVVVFRIGETDPATLVRAGSETGETVPSTFYAAIEQPSGKRDDPETAAQFWNNPAKGPGGGATPQDGLDSRTAGGAAMSEMEAMRRFVRWARAVDAAVQASGGALIIVSDTAAGDFPMLDAVLGRYAQSVRGAPPCLLYLFGEYRPLRDISAFYFGLGGSLQFHGSEDVALAALGLDSFPDEVTKYAHDHNPLNDALEIGAKASFVLARARVKQ